MDPRLNAVSNDTKVGTHIVSNRSLSSRSNSKSTPTEGYVCVKIYTDPYYRYLPPLSAATQNYDLRLARLPHKNLRNEAEWRRFLESLNPTTPPPKPPTPVPTAREMARQRTEELKKKLPIISLLPKWLQEVRDKNDIRTSRYRKDSGSNVEFGPGNGATGNVPNEATTDRVPHEAGGNMSNREGDKMSNGAANKLPNEAANKLPNGAANKLPNGTGSKLPTKGSGIRRKGVGLSSRVKNSDVSVRTTKHRVSALKSR